MVTSKSPKPLSQDEEQFIMFALKAWAVSIQFYGDIMEFYGVAWEAWEDGKRRGIDGPMLTQRIIWRLTDAIRTQASPLCSFGASIELFENLGGGVLSASTPDSVLRDLQAWAINEYPDLEPVLTGEIPLEEVRNLKKAKRRTKCHLISLTATGTREHRMLTGRRMVLNMLRRLKTRLKKCGYRIILKESTDSGSVR